MKKYTRKNLEKINIRGMQISGACSLEISYYIVNKNKSKRRLCS